MLRMLIARKTHLGFALTLFWAYTWGKQLPVEHCIAVTEQVTANPGELT
jgi:hypothetical protein